MTHARWGLSLALAMVWMCLPVTSASAAPEPAACCGPIAPAGERLAAMLDKMRVESLWLADEHVNWETGEPDRGKGYEGPGNHTHCSAFAASAAKRLGVYLLRPPEHGQELLSNAQAKWLDGSEGRTRGWRRLQATREAQELANRGELVMVVYQNPDPKRPGHVAIVRPSVKPLDNLLAHGPQIIMAGEHNHASTTVKIGFSNHPGAWPDGVVYYVHSVQ